MTRLSTKALTVASMCCVASAAMANPLSKWDKPAQDDSQTTIINTALLDQAAPSAKDAMWNPLNPIWSKLPGTAAAESFGQMSLTDEAPEADYSKGSLSQDAPEADYSKGSVSQDAPEAEYSKGSLAKPVNGSLAKPANGSLAKPANGSLAKPANGSLTKPVTAEHKPGAESAGVLGDCGGPDAYPNKPMPWEKPAKSSSNGPDSVLSSMYVPGIGHFEVLTAK